MNENSYDVIKTLLRTEKGSKLMEQNQYLFKVSPKANKIQIKKAVEDLYKVHVVSVNTMVVSGKLKRVRLHPGYTRSWKKAIVTLKEGDTIEMATS